MASPLRKTIIIQRQCASRLSLLKFLFIYSNVLMVNCTHTQREVLDIVQLGSDVLPRGSDAHLLQLRQRALHLHVHNINSTRSQILTLGYRDKTSMDKTGPDKMSTGQNVYGTKRLRDKRSTGT